MNTDKSFRCPKSGKWSSKITTRCPSCHNQTLFLNEQGQLICSWIECRNPALIHTMGEVKEAWWSLVNIHELKEILDKATHGNGKGIFLDCIASDSCKATTETIKP